MEIVINPAYEHLRDFIARLPEVFPSQGETIYKSRNEIKVFNVDGLRLNVKRYHIPSPPNRLVYTFFRPAKVYRAYRYAYRLLEKGFDTPEPVAYLMMRRFGLVGSSYFVSIQSPYTRNFYEFGRGALQGREDIAAALGRYTARLHDAGIYHCDYSPGNILFDRDAEGKIALTLVDINRMQFGAVPLEKGCANFARLWGKREFFRLVAREYAAGRNFDPDWCEGRVMHYRDAFWKKHARRHFISFEMD